MDETGNNHDQEGNPFSMVNSEEQAFIIGFLSYVSYLNLSFKILYSFGIPRG